MTIVRPRGIPFNSKPPGQKKRVWGGISGGRDTVQPREHCCMRLNSRAAKLPGRTLRHSIECQLKEKERDE